MIHTRSIDRRGNHAARRCTMPACKKISTPPHSSAVGKRTHASVRGNTTTTENTPTTNTLQALVERVQKLEQLLLRQQISTSPAIEDTSQSIHRILLTDTVSSRMELPALHNFVVADDIRGTRQIPVRSMHTVRVGDRLTDGKTQTYVVDVSEEEIVTAHPMTFGSAEAVPTVPEKYALPSLYYVYNLSNKHMHAISGATAITIRPAHSVTMSLTHAGFRLVQR